MKKCNAQKDLDRAMNEICRAFSLLDFHHNKPSSPEDVKTRERVDKAIARLETGLNMYKKGLALERGLLFNLLAE